LSERYELDRSCGYAFNIIERCRFQLIVKLSNDFHRLVFLFFRPGMFINSASWSLGLGFKERAREDQLPLVVLPSRIEAIRLCWPKPPAKELHSSMI
jgi:hypothetical protein